MSGTRAGGLKAANTNKTKYGADFYARQGAKGGKADHGNTKRKGWGGNRELARRAGRLGGLKSRRGKNSFVKQYRASNQDPSITLEEPHKKTFIDRVLHRDS